MQTYINNYHARIMHKVRFCSSFRTLTELQIKKLSAMIKINQNNLFVVLYSCNVVLCSCCFVLRCIVLVLSLFVLGLPRVVSCCTHTCCLLFCRVVSCYVLLLLVQLSRLDHCCFSITVYHRQINITENKKQQLEQPKISG